MYVSLTEEIARCALSRVLKQWPFPMISSFVVCDSVTVLVLPSAAEVIPDKSRYDDKNRYQL